MNRERVRRAITLPAVVSFALLVLAACGGEPSLEEELEDVTRVPTMSDAAAQATNTAPDEAASPGAEGATPGAEGATPVSGAATAVPAGETAATTVEVVSYDIYFEPDELTIPANTDVTVVLPNEGVTAHNFSIDALNIDVDLAPGATEEVVINAQPGEYEYYCNVPGHKEAGMVGTLIVSEDAAAAPAGATPAAGAAVASPAGTSAPAATPAEEPAAAESVEVVSRDIFFEPDEVAIPAGTDVTFILPNEGVTAHNFSIDALNISVDQAPGETQETVINAPAGTYEYYCNVPGHKAAGMVGALIVTEEAGAAPAASQEDVATPAEAAPPEATASDAVSEQVAAGSVEVVSQDIFFEPAEVTIPADSDVTFTLPNEGVTLHNFSIDALTIDIDQAPGETQEVVINAPAGTYEYYCNVPGHKAAGMVGTLTVE